MRIYLVPFVLRKTGEVVRDLTKDDFILFEDGVEQQITHFSQAVRIAHESNHFGKIQQVPEKLNGK